MDAVLASKRATEAYLKRALAPLTWWAIGIGYVLAVAVIVLPVSWLSTGAYLAASLSLVGATIVAARVHRVNRRFVLAVSAIGGFYAASQIVDSLGDGAAYTRISNLLGLFGSICIIISLVNMLSGRASANIRSVLGDALIVGLGSWLISWVALIEPALRNRGGSLGDSILDGSYQPTGTVVLFLLVLLLFSGSGTRQASVWLVTVAMAFNLAGDVLWGLAAAGHLGDTQRTSWPSMWRVLHSCRCVHPSTVVWLKRRRRTGQQPNLRSLILTTSSLIIPIIASRQRARRSARRPRSDGLGAGAGRRRHLRVTQAVRANGRTQDDLRLSAQTDA